MRKLLSVVGLVAACCWSVAQAGEWVTPKVKEVQAKPVLGTYGPVTIDYVTGEITQGKKQTRATVVYSNIDDSSEQGVGLGGTGLDPWGDDVVCVPGGGKLSTQSFSVFNSSSADLNSVTLTVNILNYDLNNVGSWSIDLDMIDLIGEPLPAGFAVLIQVTGLDDANITVPRFAIPELAFTNPNPPAVTDIGQVTYYPTQVGWGSSVFYSMGDWWVYNGQQYPADFYMEIGVASVSAPDTLLHTTGGVQVVNFNGSNSLLGFISGYFDGNLPQRWSAIPFKLANKSTIKTITAYWFTQDGAEADNVRYIVWKRTGLNRPVDGDQVAQGVAGPFVYPGKGPGEYFHSYSVNIPLNAGDYYLTLYGDGGQTPNWLAWFTGGDKQDESLERNGMWRSRFFPSPGFEDVAPSSVQPGPYMTDPEDRWNLCFALWGTVSVGCLERGDCNQDGVVNLSDLATLLGCFNAGACCDTNGDNNTNLSDLATLLANFNTSCP